MRAWEELGHLQEIPQEVLVEWKLKLNRDGMIQQILCTCASVVRSAEKSPCALQMASEANKMAFEANRIPLTLILLLYPKSEVGFKGWAEHGCFT